MADYCKQHPRYSAKKEPNSLCGKCFELWFIRCPEERDGGLREKPSKRKPISSSAGDDFGMVSGDLS